MSNDHSILPAIDAAAIVIAMALAASAAGTAVVVHAATPAAASAPPPGIRGLWRVDQARTEPLLDRRRARIDFAEGGRLLGDTGCSAMSASYQLEGERIRIGPVTTAPATDAARCGTLQLEQEDRILTALELAATAKVRDDGLLELRDAEGRGLLRGTRFQPDADDTTP